MRGAETGAPVRGEVIDRAGAGGEGLAGGDPIALFRRDIAPPDGGGGIVRHRARGEVAGGFLQPSDGNPGRAAQAAYLGFAGHVWRLGDDGVQNPDGFVAEAGAHEKAARAMRASIGARGLSPDAIASS